MLTLQGINILENRKRWCRRALGKVFHMAVTCGKMNAEIIVMSSKVYVIEQVLR